MSFSIKKWGDGLGIRIPKGIAEQINLKTGTRVEFDTTDSILTIRQTSRPRKRPTRADLLKKMKPRHRHDEIDQGGAVCRELI